MKPWSRFPLVYEVNTRAWLNDLSTARGEPVTLANVPEDEFLAWRRRHFDAVWLMGVWQASDYSRQLALTDPEITATFERAECELAARGHRVLSLRGRRVPRGRGARWRGGPVRVPTKT